MLNCWISIGRQILSDICTYYMYMTVAGSGSPHLSGDIYLPICGCASFQQTIFDVLDCFLYGTGTLRFSQ